MNNRRDLRSRFKKLAGLDNTKPSISIPSRKMLSEARVSKLLSDGYSYTDIVLMEQTWLPAANAATDPTAMANLITNRENSIGYLNAAMPTRKSLLAFQRGPEGTNYSGSSDQAVTTSNLSSGDVDGWLNTLGYTAAEIDNLTNLEKHGNRAVNTPAYKLYKLMSDGADDATISQFLNNDPTFQAVNKNLAIRQATADGNTEASKNLSTLSPVVL